MAKPPTAHTCAAAAKYAAVHDDPDFIDAIEYFIREEQRHGECLGRFLDLAGAGRIRRNWGDTMFRLFRYTFTNLEIWATVVIMVETLALVYYNAIRRATRSTVLRTVCQQILKDEVPHIRFQYERLAIHAAMRPRWQRIAIRCVHRMLFTGIVSAVWVDHHRALRAGGHTFASYWRVSWRKMTYAWNRLDEACEHVTGGCQDSNVRSATTRQTRMFVPPVLDS